MAHLMAMENPRIKADVVEVQEFPSIRVIGVPKIVINETVEFMGAIHEETFMGKVMEAIGSGEAATKSEETAPSTLF